jgi:hypothetical protein
VVRWDTVGGGEGEKVGDVLDGKGNLNRSRAERRTAKGSECWRRMGKDEKKGGRGSVGKG